MRRFLDGLYLGAAWLSALFLVGIAVTIIAQIVGRLVGLTINSTESAGFCLAASTFLGLPYTLKQGAHIRVNLVLRSLGPRVRRLFELWCTGFATVGLAYFSYWCIDLVRYSYEFNDISPGLLAMPFWIPRSGMALGVILLTVAMADEFVLIWRGHEPSYEVNAETVLPAEGEEEPIEGETSRLEPGRPVTAPATTKEAT